MTVDQKEQHILTLIAGLPIFRRIRIALTILRGIEPESLSKFADEEIKPWETEAFVAELDRRSQELRSGKVEGISGDDFLAELRKMRNS